VIQLRSTKEISRLAHIHLEPDEEQRFEQELAHVFAWLEAIENVELNDQCFVPEHTPCLRPDVITDGGMPDAVVSNAPTAYQHFFSVPKVIES
jgi:aspartyl-tRNA(Asn)/glutamyl-tRNA(Gln) amidotransferase subunit C